MNKFKVSTKGLVAQAASEVNEARSPGFDNETAAWLFLENKGYEIIEKLGNGAYASVFSAKSSDGDLCTIKVTRSEERQAHAENERNLLEEIKSGPNFPEIEGYEYDPLYYMSLMWMKATP